MKQFILLSALTVAGGIGALNQPYWGILLYYTLAVLRPQHLWAWALPVEVRWSLIASLIVLLGLGINFAAVTKHFKFNAVSRMMLIYGFLLMASMLTAFDPYTAQAWGEEYAKILIIAMLASALIQKLWHVRVLMYMILITLGYIAYEVNYLYVMQNGRLDIFHYGFGGFDNNGAGLMIIMGLPFACCLALSGRGKWKMPVLIGCGFAGACIMHAVLMTYSRGAMLAGVVGLGWLLWHYRPRYQALAAAAVLGIAVSFMAGSEIRERFMSTSNYKTDTSAQSRLTSWAAAWQIAWDKPVLGQGIRNSNRLTRNYGGDYNGRTIHNQYLQIAADSGIPAACVYMSMLGLSLWYLGKCRRRCLKFNEQLERQKKPTNHEIEETGRMALAAQASLVIFAFDSIFLSLEMFELPWLLMAVAGVMPIVLSRRIEEITAAKTAREPAHKPRRSLAPAPLPVPLHMRQASTPQLPPRQPHGP